MPHSLLLAQRLTGMNADLINDTYACENEKMLDDVMKREFGFRGYIMTDWSAQHSTMSAAVGLDVRSPSLRLVCV